MKTVDPHTPLRLEAKAPLSHTHIETMSLLYLPVIGQEAFSTYMVLYSLIERSTLKSPEYPHAFIYDMLNMRPDAFLSARKTLEAIGLIETYRKEEAFLIECYLPLSADAFIKDSHFAAYLEKALGKDRYQDLIAHFKVTRTKLADYKPVSVRFDEVFPPLRTKTVTRSQYIEPKTKPIESEADVDIELVLDGIPTSLLQAKGRTNAVKERLRTLAYIYAYDEASLQEAIRKNLKSDGVINFESLSRSAQAHYQKERGAITKKTDSPSLSYFKNTHPRTLLEESTGHKVPTADLKVIDRLIEESDLPLEVLNVMIAYVLKELDQQFPVYNYFEKIVAEWKRLDIKDAKGAIEHVQKRIKKKQAPRKNYRKARTREQPFDTSVDWFKDYLKEGKE
ncbi:MAG: DnaD domain protein [Bacillota bacterium]